MENPKNKDNKKNELEAMFRLLKKDERYCKETFYSDSNEIVVEVRKDVTKKVRKYYKYELNPDDFGTLLYETLWRGGTWTPLYQYAFQGSWKSWLNTTAYRAVRKYLYELGIIKEWKERTPENTVITLSSHTPEGCRLFIDEVMPQGEHYSLMTKIYVDRLSDRQIMKDTDMDEERYKKARQEAEYSFRYWVLNKSYAYEDLVITDKKERHGLCRADDFWDKLRTTTDNSIDNLLGDVIGVNLNKAEVQEHIVGFLTRFAKQRLKWTDRNVYIFIQRYQGIPAKDVASEMGLSPNYIHSHYSYLFREFTDALKVWYLANS